MDLLVARKLKIRTVGHGLEFPDNLRTPLPSAGKVGPDRQADLEHDDAIPADSKGLDQLGCAEVHNRDRETRPIAPVHVHCADQDGSNKQLHGSNHQDKVERAREDTSGRPGTTSSRGTARQRQRATQQKPRTQTRTRAGKHVPDAPEVESDLKERRGRT